MSQFTSQSGRRTLWPHEHPIRTWSATPVGDLRRQGDDTRVVDDDASDGFAGRELRRGRGKVNQDLSRPIGSFLTR
jgi:hypothetical protein